MNKIKISALRFQTIVQDEKNETQVITVILTKEQLRAAQIVWQSSKELIDRICSREGYTVQEIGCVERKTLAVDLAALWEG